MKRVLITGSFRFAGVDYPPSSAPAEIVVEAADWALANNCAQPAAPLDKARPATPKKAVKPEGRRN